MKLPTPNTGVNSGQRSHDGIFTEDTRTWGEEARRIIFNIESNIVYQHYKTKSQLKLMKNVQYTHDGDKTNVNSIYKNV